MDPLSLPLAPQTEIDDQATTEELPFDDLLLIARDPDITLWLHLLLVSILGTWLFLGRGFLLELWLLGHVCGR